MEITNKLREELRKEWVNALLGEEYKQGKFFLRSKDDEFCCLGVGCDILIKRRLLPDWSAGDNSYFVENYNKYLPGTAVRIFGLEGDSGEPATHDTQLSLVDLNDEGISFKQIAKLLQKGGYWSK